MGDEPCDPPLPCPYTPSCPRLHRTHFAARPSTGAQVTSKSFNFAAKRKLPFFFVSASDGTNVVKIFQMAIMAGQKWKAAPKDDFYQEVGTQERGWAG